MRASNGATILALVGGLGDAVYASSHLRYEMDQPPGHYMPRILPRNVSPNINDSITGGITMFSKATGCSLADTPENANTFFPVSNPQFQVCSNLNNGDDIFALKVGSSYSCDNGLRPGIVYWLEDANCAATVDPLKLDSKFFNAEDCVTRDKNAAAKSFKLGCINEELRVLFPDKFDNLAPGLPVHTTGLPAGFISSFLNAQTATGTTSQLRTSSRTSQLASTTVSRPASASSDSSTAQNGDESTAIPSSTTADQTTPLAEDNPQTEGAFSPSTEQSTSAEKSSVAPQSTTL